MWREGVPDWGGGSHKGPGGAGEQAGQWGWSTVNGGAG